MLTALKQTMPPSAPIAIDASGLTKPAAGVIATSPATAPLAAPSAVGLPLTNQSIRIQAMVAAAAVLVATNALVPNPPAPSALPALNQNPSAQDRERKVVRRHRLGWEATPFPDHHRRHQRRNPELMCTTVPPAKSSAPMTRR